jgi:4-diphosphocytidyl-2-C-methyl-D-erythritol kinase
LTPGDLIEIATAVGQDVPFLLEGGTVRATGLGSTVSPLPPLPSSLRFLVVSPPVEISTRAVYEAVDGGVPSARRTPGLIAALSKGGRDVALGNDLEPASRRLFPALDEAINRLRAAVPGLTMSGTGAALFALFDRRQDAERALDGVRGLGYPAWLCRPVPAAA